MKFQKGGVSKGWNFKKGKVSKGRSFKKRIFIRAELKKVKFQTDRASNC